MAFIGFAYLPRRGRQGASLPDRLGHRSFKSRRFETKVPYLDGNVLPAAQPLRQLLRQKDRAMLAAGAAKRDHQILEPTFLIVLDTGIDQRKNAGEILMYALLLV